MKLLFGCFVFAATFFMFPLRAGAVNDTPTYPVSGHLEPITGQLGMIYFISATVCEQNHYDVNLFVNLNQDFEPRVDLFDAAVIIGAGAGYLWAFTHTDGGYMEIETYPPYRFGDMMT